MFSNCTASPCVITSVTGKARPPIRVMFPFTFAPPASDTATIATSLSICAVRVRTSKRVVAENSRNV